MIQREFDNHITEYYFYNNEFRTRLQSLLNILSDLSATPTQVDIALQTIATAENQSHHLALWLNKSIEQSKSANGKRLIGSSTRNKIAKEEREKLFAERNAMLSTAGINGAKVRHAKTQALKDWALKEAKSMLGNDKQIAKKLSPSLPDHLKNASNDPQRFIYDALRESKKKT